MYLSKRAIILIHYYSLLISGGRISFWIKLRFIFSLVAPAVDHMYLRLVAAATTLICVCARVGNRHQSAQVTHVNLIRIWRLKQTLSQELSSSVSNLTVTLHLAKPKTAITGKKTGDSDRWSTDGLAVRQTDRQVSLTGIVPPLAACWGSGPDHGPSSGSCRPPCVSDVGNMSDRWRSATWASSPWTHCTEPDHRSIIENRLVWKWFPYSQGCFWPAPLWAEAAEGLPWCTGLLFPSVYVHVPLAVHDTTFKSLLCFKS